MLLLLLLRLLATYRQHSPTIVVRHEFRRFLIVAILHEFVRFLHIPLYWLNEAGVNSWPASSSCACVGVGVVHTVVGFVTQQLLTPSPSQSVEWLFWLSACQFH